MGDTTDELIDLSKQIADEAPSAREMDMLLTTGEQASAALLAMALHRLGEQAVSFTGWQAGIYTEAVHAKARITDIRPQQVTEALDNGHIVIVAGFQGMTEAGELTTLGRGGSDTTAVAMAAALQAELCEIYTDVDGVYTTDPRIIRTARKLKHISYDEMLELANLGAAVLHPRAVEYAKHNRVQLLVRSSFTDNKGTCVQEEAAMEQGAVVRGIASDNHISRITILGVPEKPGQLAAIFTALAENNIDVDIIVQGGVRDGWADTSFTLATADLDKARCVLRRIQADIGFQDLRTKSGLVKVSIVGTGMVSSPGVAAKMFSTLAAAGISINTVSTSEIKVSCVIESDKLHDVVRALHTAFGLDTSEHAFVGGPSERR
jgi:aspartate kinase